MGIAWKVLLPLVLLLTLGEGFSGWLTATVAVLALLGIVEVQILRAVAVAAAHVRQDDGRAQCVRHQLRAGVPAGPSLRFGAAVNVHDHRGAHTGGDVGRPIHEGGHGQSVERLEADEARLGERSGIEPAQLRLGPASESAARHIPGPYVAGRGRERHARCGRLLRAAGDAFWVRRVIWNPRWVPPNEPWARGKTPKGPGDPNYNAKADAQDALQESFLAVDHALPSFRGEASPTTYLFKVTTTTCLNRLRTRRRRRCVDPARIRPPLHLLLIGEQHARHRHHQHNGTDAEGGEDQGTGHEGGPCRSARDAHRAVRGMGVRLQIEARHDGL